MTKTLPGAGARRPISPAIAATGIWLASLGAGIGYWAWRNLRAYDAGRARVARAGYRERHAVIGGSRISYGRGPDVDRPALLLIHGQGVAWQHYYPVLPRLAREYRTYAVDVHGHGGSERVPQKYSAAAIGTDLARFVEQEIGEPVIVSGPSSGGHLAAWLAGHRPDLVRGAMLEDPPLFTTLLPRARETWNWVDLATACHDFLGDDAPDADWPAYYFERQRLWQLFGSAGGWAVRRGLAQHARHPDRPISLFFMPPGWNDLQRLLAGYDPRFGDAFYTGTWDTGFDHAATLKKISAPTVLIHADWAYGPDGVLQGAMDGADAARALALLDDVELVRAHTGHNVHGERPGVFLNAIRDLAKRIDS